MPGEPAAAPSRCVRNRSDRTCTRQAAAIDSASAVTPMRASAEKIASGRPIRTSSSPRNHSGGDHTTQAAPDSMASRVLAERTGSANRRDRKPSTNANCAAGSARRTSERVPNSPAKPRTDDSVRNTNAHAASPATRCASIAPITSTGPTGAFSSSTIGNSNAGRILSAAATTTAAPVTAAALAASTIAGCTGRGPITARSRSSSASASQKTAITSAIRIIAPPMSRVLSSSAIASLSASVWSGARLTLPFTTCRMLLYLPRNINATAPETTRSAARIPAIDSCKS